MYNFSLWTKRVQTILQFKRTSEHLLLPVHSIFSGFVFSYGVFKVTRKFLCSVVSFRIMAQFFPGTVFMKFSIYVSLKQNKSYFFHQNWLWHIWITCMTLYDWKANIMVFLFWMYEPSILQFYMYKCPNFFSRELNTRLNKISLSHISCIYHWLPWHLHFHSW